MSSKSINVILSYTISKLVRFFETQCIFLQPSEPDQIPQKRANSVAWLSQNSAFCRKLWSIVIVDFELAVAILDMLKIVID